MYMFDSSAYIRKNYKCPCYAIPYKVICQKNSLLNDLIRNYGSYPRCGILKFATRSLYLWAPGIITEILNSKYTESLIIRST